MNYLKRRTKTQIRDCLGLALRKLDNEMINAYNKMMEQSGEYPAPSRTQIILSPNKSRFDDTPTKQGYISSSRSEILNQKSSSRKAYRSRSKERAIANQVLNKTKPVNISTQHPIIEEYSDDSEITEEFKILTRIINEKQKLIVGIKKKLGEFIGNFRSTRN